MKLYTTNKLTDREIARVKILEQECRFHDGTKRDLFLSSEMNFHKEMHCFFLLYDHKDLCAVLTLFAPTLETAEVSAQVLPDYRRKGCFKELLAAASREAGTFGVKRILFIHEPTCDDAKNLIDKWNVDLSHSEYLLSFDRGEEKDRRKTTGTILIRPAMRKDLPAMADLNARAFSESVQTSQNLVNETFENDKMLSFCAFLSHELIGVCNVSLAERRLSIFGLCIAPGYQSRGYGKELLDAVLDFLKEYSGEITLEVGSNNQRAFAFYQRRGFRVKGQYDYYNYPV